MKRRIITATLWSLFICPIAFAQQAATHIEQQRVSAQVYNAYALPKLTLRADNPTPSPQQIVHFTAAWDRQVPAMTYHFDWGDGQSNNTRLPAFQHSYAKAGSYTVRVTAQNVEQHAPPIVSNPLAIQVALPSLESIPGVPPAILLPAAALTISADNLYPQQGAAVRVSGKWNRESHACNTCSTGETARQQARSSRPPTTPTLGPANTRFVLRPVLSLQPISNQSLVIP